MDGWLIDPGAARAVLTQARTDADEGMRATMQAAAQSIEQAHGVTGPRTRAALLSLGSELFEAEIAATRARLRTNISAVSHAVDAYVEGDEHMVVTWSTTPR
ncbi:DUF6507 family protein [Curtobacterium sp. Leaf261]|uniref:DUF6507 family protein n=1 Tax=Curtobacterium sp. Leaf261 TaxID=1736311 RepID=UPI0006F53603|nr:DUF6507 family protein [Curtobacterium sp. Leaf261]KQO64996.1 hypothetical protein ASF23_02255 [Curtobacterium sp. Leaf261]